MKSWKTLVACAAMTLSVAAYGCDRNDTRTTQQTDPAPTPDVSRDVAPVANTAIDVDDVVKDADRYVGQEITVAGEVDEVLSPMAFALDEDAPFQGGVDNDLLVFYPKSSELADLDDQWLNDEVHVTGTLGKMSVIEVEREVGWDLDSKLEAEVEKQGYILIAKRVQRVQ